MKDIKFIRRHLDKNSNFSPTYLFQDETTLIWYAGKEQKQLQLSKVSRIIPGQRTVSFNWHHLL